MRRAVQEVDRTIAVSGVKTMEQYLDDSLAAPRLHAALVSAFASLALVMATIGLYGLIAYVVSQRTAEIGIRMALGAERRDVFRAVFTEGALLDARRSGDRRHLCAVDGACGFDSALRRHRCAIRRRIWLRPRCSRASRSSRRRSPRTGRREWTQSRRCASSDAVQPCAAVRFRAGSRRPGRTRSETRRARTWR